MVKAKNNKRRKQVQSFFETTFRDENEENRTSKAKRGSRNEPHPNARKNPKRPKLKGGLLSFAQNCDGSSIEEVACSLTNRIDRLDKSKALLRRRTGRNKTPSATTASGLSCLLVSRQSDFKVVENSEPKRITKRQKSGASRRGGKTTKAKHPPPQMRKTFRSTRRSGAADCALQTEPSKPKRRQAREVSGANTRNKSRNQISSFLLIDCPSSTDSKPLTRNALRRQIETSGDTDSNSCAHGSFQQGTVEESKSDEKRKVTFAPDAHNALRDTSRRVAGRGATTRKAAAAIVEECAGHFGSNQIVRKEPFPAPVVQRLRRPRDPSPTQHGPMKIRAHKSIEQANHQQPRRLPRDPTPCKPSFRVEKQRQDPSPIRMESRCNEVAPVVSKVHSADKAHLLVAVKPCTSEGTAIVDAIQVRNMVQETPLMHSDDSISALSMTPALLPKEDPPCGDIQVPINLHARRASVFTPGEPATESEAAKAAASRRREVERSDESQSVSSSRRVLRSSKSHSLQQDTSSLLPTSLANDLEDARASIGDHSPKERRGRASDGETSTDNEENGGCTDCGGGPHNENNGNIVRDRVEKLPGGSRNKPEAATKPKITKRKSSSSCNMLGVEPRRSRRERKQTDRFTFAPSSGASVPSCAVSTKGIDDESEYSDDAKGTEHLEAPLAVGSEPRPRNAAGHLSDKRDHGKSCNHNGNGDRDDGDLSATRSTTKRTDATSDFGKEIDKGKAVLSEGNVPKKPPPAQRRTLRAFKLHVPTLKSKFAPENVPEWSDHQLDQLRAAHASVKPTSRAFWWEVAALVDDKTAQDCRETWFSFSKTPNTKERGQGKSVSNTEDDDLFQSMPLSALCQSTKIRSSVLKVGKPPAKKVVPQPDTKHHSPVPPVLARGYKGYLNNMRKDVARAEKVKGRKAAPIMDSTKVVSEYDAAADVRVRLTPSGTLRVRHNLHESGGCSADDFDEDDASTLME